MGFAVSPARVTNTGTAGAIAPLHHADRAKFHRGQEPADRFGQALPPTASFYPRQSAAMNAFHATVPLVEIENLSKHYGDFEAVSQFSLKVVAASTQRRKVESVPAMADR